MKTLLDLDDDLLQRAKQRAAAEGISLRAYLEDALRAKLLTRAASPFRLDLPIIRGQSPPAVDIANRDALYDSMGRGP